MRFQCAGLRNTRHGFQSKLTKHKLRKYKWKGLARTFHKKAKEATSRHLKMENTYRRGVKRKWEGDHEEDYVKLRSTMYDLFYKKFHSRIPGKEVPLLRSILLRESIRSLEYELFEEGLMRSQQAAEAAIDTPMAQLTLDPIPDTFSFPLPSSPLPAFTEVPQGLESDQSDFVTLASKLVDSLTESGIVDLLQSSSMNQEESMQQSSLMSSSPPPPMYCNLQPPVAGPASSSSSAFSGSYNMYSSPSSHSQAAVVDSTGLEPVGGIPSLPASAYDGVAMDITPSLPPFSSWAPSLLSHELQKVLDEGDSNNNSNSSSSMSNSSSSSSSSSLALGPYNYMLSGEEAGVAVAAAAADWGDFSEQDVLDLFHSCQQKQDAALVASGTDSAAAPLPPSSQPTVSSASSSPSSNPGLGGQCVTFCRSDSAVDELDSIMQVIVGN